MLHNPVSLLTTITMTALAPVLALLPLQAERVCGSGVGGCREQGTAGTRSPPRWLMGGQARQTSAGCKKTKAERLPVNSSEASVSIK